MNTVPVIVLADEQGAYVGSANMLRYEVSALELGVLAKGRGVEVVRAAVDAAIACASPLSLPSVPIGEPVRDA